MCAFKLEEPSSVGVPSKKKKEKRKPSVITEKSLVSDTRTTGEIIEKLQDQIKSKNKQDLYSDIAYQISYRCRDISRDSLNHRPFTTKDIEYVMNNGWFRLDDAMIIHNTAVHACIMNYLEDQDNYMLGSYYSEVYEEIGFTNWEVFTVEQRGEMVRRHCLRQLADYLEDSTDLWDTFLAETDFVYEDFHVILFC